MKLKKWLLISDTHRPYHNPKAVELTLKVGQHLKVDGIVTLGDYGDCYSISSHDKNPLRVNNLEEEILSMHEGLDEYDSLGAKEKIFIMGNHEDRLERYLMTKAPELFNMVKMEELLNLKERGWKSVPYKNYTKIGKLHVTHDVGSAGATAHTRALNDFQDNIVIGHTHRLGYAVVGNVKGKPHVGAMLGWLGDANACDYMFKAKAAKDWALGFGVAYIEPNGDTHVVPIPIINNKVVVEGKLFKA